MRLAGRHRQAARPCPSPYRAAGIAGIDSCEHNAAGAAPTRGHGMRRPRDRS